MENKITGLIVCECGQAFSSSLRYCPACGKTEILLSVEARKKPEPEPEPKLKFKPKPKPKQPTMEDIPSGRLFTICNHCNTIIRGEVKICPRCDFSIDLHSYDNIKFQEIFQEALKKYSRTDIEIFVAIEQAMFKKFRKLNIDIRLFDRMLESE